MPHYEKAELRKLIDGELEWSRVQEIMKAPKDDDRFLQWIELRQEDVAWNEKILLPLTFKLFIVQKGPERIVKCECGQEFGDYRVNWKLSANIFVRESEDDLREVYRGREQPDTSWQQIREYYCPGCDVQLEVEAVPRGCPPDFNLLPDLDTFYRDWLGKPLDGEVEFADKTQEVIDSWEK